MLHRPHSLQPCQHSFCEPCLRRLARAEIHTCTICRSFITNSRLDEGNTNISLKVKRTNVVCTQFDYDSFFSELHDSIETQYQDVYIQRQQEEMALGIFNEPLPPVRRTLAEIFHLRQGLFLLLLLMMSLMVLIKSGILLIFLIPMVLLMAACLMVPINLEIGFMLDLVYLSNLRSN